MEQDDKIKEQDKKIMEQDDKIIRQNRRERVIKRLEELSIEYKLHEHPPLPTIEIAMEHWKNIDTTHCKNIFFRNHKGNKHYLVILEASYKMDIHDMEKRLRQGKLSFASEQRMEKYLGLSPGSVSPFGIINDKEHHVMLFIDKNLMEAKTLGFHPNENSATVVLSKDDLIKFIESQGNIYEITDLY